MTKPKPNPDSPPRGTPSQRKQVGHALRLWVGVTLGATSLLAALAIWHLKRRGQRLRERLGPPREILWPDLTPRSQAAPPLDPHPHKP